MKKFWLIPWVIGISCVACFGQNQTINKGGNSVAAGTNAVASIPLPFVYYVATNGSSGNNGLTTNTAWDLATAMASGPNNAFAVMPGQYTNILISSSGQKWFSLVPWGARIVGQAGFHGISTTGNGVVSNVTVAGFEVYASAIDGIKFNGPNCSAIGCWVHNSFGQGVAAHNYNNILIDTCLIEWNGTDPQHDHGIYFAGTNCTVRNCVIRYNKDYGLHGYDGTGNCVNSRVYNNLIYGNPKGATIWTYDTSTNYFLGNTIIAWTNDAITPNGGSLAGSNNILICGASFYPVNTNGTIGCTTYLDYNLTSKSIAPSGPHDVVQADASTIFVNTNSGLFWLKPLSAARGMAKPTVYGPVDFFGGLQVAVADVGAFQYHSALAGDYRTLDPSTTNGANYWFTPGISKNSYYGTLGGDGLAITNLNASALSSGTMPIARMPAFTGGDATTSPASGAIILNNVNANTGTWGDSTHVAQIAVNSKGLITGVTPVLISAGASQTPWTGNIDGGGFSLSDVSSITLSNKFIGTNNGTGNSIVWDGTNLLIFGGTNIDWASSGVFTNWLVVSNSFYVPGAIGATSGGLVETNGINFGNPFSSPGSGTSSEQFGVGASASAIRATAYGANSSASGGRSTAIGTFSAASGSNAIALGSGPTAAGLNASALGSFANAALDNSTAVGQGAHTSNTNQIMLGVVSGETHVPGTLVVDGAQTNTGLGLGVGHFNSGGGLSSSAVVLADMANESPNTVIGNNTGSPATPLALSVSQVLDMIGSTRGAILERGASGWVLINPGASGTFLGGNGGGADPTYQTPAGGGGGGTNSGPITLTAQNNQVLISCVNPVGVVTNSVLPFRLTLTNNFTITNAVGMVDDQAIRLTVVQDATGGRTLSWWGAFTNSSGYGSNSFGRELTGVNISTNANSWTKLIWRYQTNGPAWQLEADLTGY